MKTRSYLFFVLVFIHTFFFLHAQVKDPVADSLKKIGDSLQKQADYFQNKADSIIKSKEALIHWKKGGVFNIGGTQVSLSNWAGGGQNSVAIGSIFNGFINYKKEKINWDNSLTMQYGLIKQGGNKTWWKNDDQFQFTSKYGHEASKYWFYSALLDFKSQFAPGYNFPNDSVRISNLLAPAYGILALGMDFKVKDYFAILIAPATGKFTVVNDTKLADAGAFGVTPAVLDTGGAVLTHGKKFRSEMGGYVKVKFKKEIIHNVTIETNVELFSNYVTKPENIDVMWNTLISFKINRLLTTTLSTYLIYDDDVKIPVDRNGDGASDGTGPRVQFKQVFSIAFALKLK
ncbi:MAG: DUF3078 domain-containing protein [Bacteroidia bacterium]|nr:DUF3078 domain-containing protein [Bacteroidia bacterium]